MPQVKVLMVCLGNICRSPTAEGVFRSQLTKKNLNEAVSVDSAGTSDWHVGASPDSRSVAAAANRGYALEQLRGRQVNQNDFDEFDYIMAMDQENYDNLMRICPPEQRDKVKLFLSFGSSDHREVPDPYHSGPAGFELVIDLIEDAGQGALDHLISTHKLI